VCLLVSQLHCCPLPRPTCCPIFDLTPGPAFHLQGFEGLTQRIADYQAEKEARAAAVKAEEEARRLRECSFSPEINRQRVQAKVGGCAGQDNGCWQEGVARVHAWAVDSHCMFACPIKLAL